MYTLEICANSYTSALAAQNGGADRVELCDNMAEGGTTPSYAQIALCKRNLTIKIFPIIRPRGGDFYYSDIEFELMKIDIVNCKSLGCDGVVTGILTADGAIDIERTKALIEFARPMEVSFHRAFDMCKNMPVALEAIIGLGCERVLTSGGAETAESGIEMIAKLVKQAAGRISIMPGAGVNPANIAAIENRTGAKEFHTTAKTTIQTKMNYKNNVAKVGNIDEYAFMQTDSEIVSTLVEILKTNS